MTPFGQAWSVLKEMQPAFQDDPNAAPENMRHYGQMQQQMERFMPRGTQPQPVFGPEWAAQNPWMGPADLRFQADNSRHPADARRFQEQADQMEAAMQPAPAPETQPELSDMDNVMRILAEAERRARAPYSYRRKIKPLSDQEVSRDLRRIRNFRR
jgi:erythromycin esterase-like protein|tara:strand:- start:541 stop:1008 length:468 start_codon:yes stop_codon:yes gene_type:complete